MRIITTIGLLLALSAAAHAETIFYGSRAGEEVTVTDKSNIDSADARITAKLTKANAMAYCREYVQKVTRKCVSETMKTELQPEISANCETGEFQTFYGQGYRFQGKNPDYDAAGSSTEFLLVEADGKEPLDGSSASGYDVALGQFKALCPNRVN
ncbi:hypothetical protein CYK37_15000 [Mesorhizobium loti]|nr:hypothetical protein [Mesorhizobium loti]PLP58223.1 hypothetical protein CYK37_15000 [Mesorhizobium loti]